MAGALGGLLLQSFATTVVTGSGDLNAPTNVEIFASEALMGVVVGAIAMLAVGLIIKERAKGS